MIKYALNDTFNILNIVITQMKFNGMLIEIQHYN